MDFTSGYYTTLSQFRYTNINNSNTIDYYRIQMKSYHIANDNTHKCQILVTRIVPLCQNNIHDHIHIHNLSHSHDHSQWESNKRNRSQL